MPCTACTVNFTIFKRKNRCNLCMRFFCLGCYSTNEKRCVRCTIVFRNPKPLKEDLMKIKTKELIFYLHLMGVDFKNCVEKEELVELLVNHTPVRRPTISPSGSSHYDDYASFEQMRKSVSNKCQNLFTTFSEKLNSGENSSSRKTSAATSPQTNSHVSTPKSDINAQFDLLHDLCPQPGTSKSFASMEKSNHHSSVSSASIISINNVRPTILRRNSDTNLLQRPQHEAASMPLECVKCEKLKSKMRKKLNQISHKLDEIHERHQNDDEFLVIKRMVNESRGSLGDGSSETSSSLASVSLRFPDQDTELADDSVSVTQQTPHDLNNGDIVDILSDNNNVDTEQILVCPMIIEVRQQSPTSAGSSGVSSEGTTTTTNDQQSTRRFFTLEDVKSKEDFEELSVKQLKEILSINRVNFKGCCEKNELKERALRLWNDHVSTLPIEKMPNEDLCKICFSSGVSCVFLECGHCCTCVDCGKILNECPVCRSYITRIVRVFKS